MKLADYCHKGWAVLRGHGSRPLVEEPRAQRWIRGAVVGLASVLLSGWPAFTAERQADPAIAELRQGTAPPGREAAPATPTPAGKNGATGKGQEEAPALDLDTMVQRLRRTDAIGFFTKISLKFQFDDLLDALRAYYNGKGNETLTQLREDYDLLLLKLVTLLQDGDPTLAHDIAASRDALWKVLSDPEKLKKS